MVDNLAKGTRSKVMASIKGRDTVPEMMVRRLLWAHGIRYRVHNTNLPGKPDISNSRSKVAVFIDGCFWHGCRKCYKEPTSNVEFWRAKLRRNIRRRKAVKRELKTRGWTVLEFWEHSVMSSPNNVMRKIKRVI
jgi:DNA mismatch endonuclease (patch repair protein)